MNLSLSIGADFSLNFSTEAKFSFDNLRIYATVGLPKNKNDKKYENIILRTTFDACKMLRGSKGDFLGNIIISVVKKYSDRELKCPSDIAKYNFRNIVIEDDFVPKFLLTDDFRALVAGKIVGKVLPQQKTAELLSAKIYVRIAKN